MTRLHRDLEHRIERDLSQISDRATPSSTAWEAIRTRIDEQDTEPTMEVIMLDPEHNKLQKRPRTGWLVAASVAAITLVGGLVVLANRDDDTPPADRPDPTVPISEPAIAGDAEPAPVAVDPDLPVSTDGVAVSAPVGEVLPPADLPTQGVQSAICTTGNFDENDDGSVITGPQTCVLDGDPLPVAALERNTLDIYLSGPDTPDLFVSVGDNGAFTAGYTTADGSVRYSGVQPGVDDFAGETVHFLGVRADGSELTPGISDWTTDPGDTPLPSTEEGGISAELIITCEAEFVSGDDTEQVLDQSCTYSSDDRRFDRASDVLRVRIVPAESGSTTLAEYPLFVTSVTGAEYTFAGIAEDTTTLRGVGVRPGTGEFDGMLVHDVAYLVTSSDGGLSGTIRTTVYPDA